MVLLVARSLAVYGGAAAILLGLASWRLRRAITG